MKHLKEYKLWEQSRELTPEQEGFLNRYVRGTWGINSEGLVDVEGDFDCAREGLNNFQGILIGLNVLFILTGSVVALNIGTSRVLTFVVFGEVLESVSGSLSLVDDSGVTRKSLQNAKALLDAGYRFD